VCTFTWQGRASRLAQLARPQNDGRGSRDETARHTLHTVIQNAPNVEITYCVKQSSPLFTPTNRLSTTVRCHPRPRVFSPPRSHTITVVSDLTVIRCSAASRQTPGHIAMHNASAHPSHAHRYYTYTDDVEWQPCTSIEMHDPPARHPSTPVPHASPRGEQWHPPSRLTARAQDSLSPGQRKPRTLAPCSAIPTGAFGVLAIRRGC
jgi:hypothetical protein